MSQEIASYAVVAFDEANEVSVIPNSWLSENEKMCYWPPFKGTSKLSRAIQDMWDPQEYWDKHPARVLTKCDTYSRARIMSQKAEQCSDIQSEGEYGRGYRRIKSKRKYSDSDSETSSGSTVELPKKSKFLPPPPELDDLPPLRRQHATTQRPSCSGSSSTPSPKPPRLDTSPAGASNRSEDTKLILRAVARCEATVEHQNKMLQDMTNMLQTLMKDREQPSVTEQLSSLMPNLPIETQDQFNELNDKLDSDSGFEKLLYRRLAMLGGSSVKLAVKRMIDTCMSNSLQVKYNWEGRLGWKNKDNESKTGFKTTRLCFIITRVLLDNKKLPTTEEEIEKAIMIYLRNAADRCGGRSRRRTNTAESTGES